MEEIIKNIEKFDMKLIYVLIIILVSYIVSNIIKLLISKFLKLTKRRNKKVQTISKLLGNITNYIIYIIAILLILSVFNVNTKSILASLGIVGLVIGLALQDLLKDFLAGMSIILEDQYNIGDSVTINGFRGEIMALGLKTTKLKSLLGDVKIISNRLITEVINHSLLPSRAFVEVSVSYETNLLDLTSKMEKFVKTIKNDDIIGDVVFAGVNELSASGIVVGFNCLCNNNTHYSIQRYLRMLIKEELEKLNIEIPYPQLVIHEK